MLALAGCQAQYPQSTGFNNGSLPPLPGGEMPPPPGGGSAPEGATGKTGGPVALLVPLTGDLAPVGQALENAAKLAFPADSSVTLDVRDTGGTAQGAAAAAQAAIAAAAAADCGPSPDAARTSRPPASPQAQDAAAAPPQRRIGPG